jgi:hypothetical protein
MLTQITDRLSVEGPDSDGHYVARLLVGEGDEREVLTESLESPIMVAMVDALIARLRPRG